MNEVHQKRRPRVFLEGARGNRFLQKMVAPQKNSFFSFSVFRFFDSFSFFFFFHFAPRAVGLAQFGEYHADEHLHRAGAAFAAGEERVFYPAGFYPGFLVGPTRRDAPFDVPFVFFFHFFFAFALSLAARHAHWDGPVALPSSSSASPGHLAQYLLYSQL